MKTIKQLLITIAVLLCSATTYAYDFSVDGIYYNIISSEDLTVEVTNGDEDYSGEVVIPSILSYSGNEYCVTSIGESVFYGCSGLVSISIPESVTSIGNDAFTGCTSLINLQIEDGNTTLELGYIDYEYDGYEGEGLFRDCPLKTLYIGRNLSYNSHHSYGYSPFFNKDELEYVIFSNKVTSIGSGALGNCDGLTSIEIPCSVISIESPSHTDYDSGAFEGCSNLKTVTFEENSQLTSIGGYAFRECSSLTSIEIPNSVFYIGGGAFYHCESLTSIEIPRSVISIESIFEYGYYIGAFEACSNLRIVTFGENYRLTSIGGSAFRECLSLTNIEIPNSVTSIGDMAFLDCFNLSSIEIPNSVTSIGEKAFYGCTSLKDFKLEDGYTTLELGYRLFKNCALETIYLGRNISYDNSENPEDLLFDDMITLKSLTVGSSVTEIPGKTFYDCTNLESVYMRGVPPVISDDTFSNASFYIATLYVPEGTLAFYQAANVWKNFWNIQEYEPTSIEDIESDEVKFTISSNGISFSNANNTTIAIYTINGILVEKIDKYTGEDIFLDKGIYIVSVGNKTMKIKL